MDISHDMNIVPVLILGVLSLCMLAGCIVLLVFGIKKLIAYVKRGEGSIAAPIVMLCASFFLCVGMFICGVFFISLLMLTVLSGM